MRDIFTWGRRKKVFYPNGEINWNILVPAALQQKSFSRSSPHLNAADGTIDSCSSSSAGSRASDGSSRSTDAASSGMPYFLPASKQLRPSLRCLFGSSLSSDAERGVSLPDSPHAGCTVLTTFQPDPLLGQTSPSERFYGLLPEADGYSSQDTKGPFQRRLGSSLSAMDLLSMATAPRYPLPAPPVSASHTRCHSTSAVPQLRNNQESQLEYRQILVNRPHGQKFALNLDISKDKKSKKVRQVVVKSVYLGCELSASEASLQPGDTVLRMNELDLTTLSRKKCVKLFQDAPATFTLLICRRIRVTGRRPEDENCGDDVFEPASRAPREDSDRDAWCSRSKPLTQYAPSAQRRKRLVRPTEPPPPPPLDALKVQHNHEPRESFYDMPCEEFMAEFEKSGFSPTGFDNVSWSSSTDNDTSSWSEPAAAINPHAVDNVRTNRHLLTSFQPHSDHSDKSPHTAASSPTRLHYASSAVPFPAGSHSGWEAAPGHARSWLTVKGLDCLTLDLSDDGNYCDTVLIAPNTGAGYTPVDTEQGQAAHLPALRQTDEPATVLPMTITADTLRRRKETLNHVSPKNNTENRNTAAQCDSDNIQVAPPVEAIPTDLPSAEEILCLNDLPESSVDEAPTGLPYSTPRVCKQVTFQLEESNSATPSVSFRARWLAGLLSSPRLQQQQEGVFFKSILKKSPRSSVSSEMDLVRLDFEADEEQLLDSSDVVQCFDSTGLVKGPYTIGGDGSSAEEPVRFDGHADEYARRCSPPLDDDAPMEQQMYTYTDRRHSLTGSMPAAPDISCDDSSVVYLSDALSMETSGSVDGYLSGVAELSLCSADHIGQSTTLRTMEFFEDGDSVFSETGSFSRILPTADEEGEAMSEWSEEIPPPPPDHLLRDSIGTFANVTTDFLTSRDQYEEKAVPDELNDAWSNCLKSPWPQSDADSQDEDSISSSSSYPTTQSHQQPLHSRRWSVPEYQPVSQTDIQTTCLDSTTITQSADDVHTGHRPRLRSKPVPPPKPAYLQCLSGGENAQTKTGNPIGKLTAQSSLNSSTAYTATDDQDSVKKQQQCDAPVSANNNDSPITTMVAAVTPVDIQTSSDLINLTEDTEPADFPPPPEELISHSPDSGSSTVSFNTNTLAVPTHGSGAMVEYAKSLEWMRHSTDSGYTGDRPAVSLFASLTETVYPELTSLSVSDSSGGSLDSGSDLEYEGSSETSVDGVVVQEDDRCIEILHTSWDIGIKIERDERGQCVIAQVARTSRLPGVKEGDVLRTINGQSLEGMTELQISTLLRALPRGLVRMTVRDGLKYQNGINSPKMTEPFSSSSTHYSYSKQSHYGSTQNVPSPSSTTIVKPIVRSEVSMQAAGRVGQPAEFVIKINKLGQNAERTYETNHAIHPSHLQPTFNLIDTTAAPPPLPMIHPPSYQTQRQTNGEYRRSYFTDSSSTTSDSQESDISRSQTGFQTSSRNDPYKIGRDLASDEFKKKREKFLGISQETNSLSSQFKNGFHGSLGNVAYTGGVKEFVIPIQREEPSSRGDYTSKRQSASIGPQSGWRHEYGKVSGEYNIPIQREVPSVPVSVSEVEVKIDNHQSAKSSPYEKQRSTEKQQSEPAVTKIQNAVQKEEPIVQSLTSSRTVQTARKTQTATAAPPVTQPYRSWQDQRGRSSSISSASSSVSLHSTSSTDAPAKSDAGKEATAKAVLESRASSGARDRHTGWVSPAQVSRQIPGRKDVPTGQSRFSEAMARYKAQTEPTPETEMTGSRLTERRGSKPVVVPVASKTVHDKASIFEQKSQDGGAAAPMPAPLLLSQRSRSLSQASLPTTPITPTSRDSFQSFSGRPQAKITISSSEEPDVERSSWTTKDRSTRHQTSTPVPETIDQLKPAQQDDLLIVRGSRDSGVSSRNSSVTYDHDFNTGHNDVFPPAPENIPELENIVSPQPVRASEVPVSGPKPVRQSTIPEPPIEEIFYNPKKETAAPPAHGIANQKSSFLAVVEEAKEPAVVKRQEKTTGRPASPAMPHIPVTPKKTAEAVPTSQTNTESMSEDNRELVEMAKSILGEDARTEEIFVIDLVRPDGSTGGGVGMVLTGGADYEVNQIKVNKVISHSLAHRDGRVQAGDRLLLINGQSCSNMTHRQALEVLKAPRAQVSLVLSRRAGEGDSVVGKSGGSENSEDERPLQTVDVRVDKRWQDSVSVPYMLCRSGLGLTMDGGHSDTLTGRPLTIRRISKGAISEPDHADIDASHCLQVGDELVSVNTTDCRHLSRLDCTRLLKSLPEGDVVTLTIRR